MTIFYRGRCVRITHEVMEVWCPTYQRFAIRELRWVYVIAQPVAPPAAVSAVRTGSTGLAGATAVVASLGWAEGWRALESPVPALIIVVLLITAFAAGGACWSIRPVERTLIAGYHGRQVCLYRSRDPREFGQVQRALTRSIEQQSDRS